MIPKSTAIRFFFAFILTLFLNHVNGQSGKDGVKTISISNSVVNDYTVLTLDVAAGSTIIQVANNSLSTGFLSPISTGDLVFIIQVQGATIGSADDSTYGTINSYQNCGNYEYAEVAAISGLNGITLACPLRNNYSTAGKTMVIRVPRYSALTINGGGSITCPAWNGSIGGIIAIEVYGVTMINSGGSIDASGKGFRGGSLINSPSWYAVGNYRWATNDYGAEKGESIAGSVTDYDLMGGRYCKGAPANGGGGGSAHNGGGGGGANSGNIAGYTGNGNPDNSNATWAAAWNLQSAGFAGSTSSGGGKGGYSFSSSNQNALTAGPGNASWGGDFRRDNGGRGGHPLDYSTGRIFFGGGGGAGEENDSKGGNGGKGGGIISMLCYADISGSGQIVSNGTNGASTTGSNGTDGAGGGGGGGTVLLNTTGLVSGVSVSANGGNGGSQIVSIFNLETEGPGGGGSGGYIAVSNGTPVRLANGGNNGTTNSLSMTEFIPNGATKGGSGFNNAGFSTFQITAQPVNLCSLGTAILSITVLGTPPTGIVYNWYDQPFGGTVLGTGTTITTPILSVSKTYYVGYCPGTIRIPVQVNISTLPSVSFTSSNVCAGNPTVFTSSGSTGITSWNWNFGNGSGTSTQQNPSYAYPSGGTYNVTLTVSDGVCSASTSQSVIVSSTATVSFAAAGALCGSRNVQFTNNTTPAAPGYTWNFGDGSPVDTQINPLHTFLNAGTFSVILSTTGPGCSSADTINVFVSSAPQSSFSANTSICQNDTVFFTDLSLGNGSSIISRSWDFGDGSPASTFLNPSHSFVSNGTFNVKLTVSSSTCSDDTIISINVNTAPVANFTASATSGCPPLNVVFTNSTSGAPQYSWNFGDGSPVSTQSNTSHIYTNPGSYSVTLIATQGSCSDTFQLTNNIVVAQAPLSSFNVNAFCLGDSTHFINTSTGGSIGSYSWNFGDGDTSNASSPSHLYSASGTYFVLLSVNASNCSDDTTINIQINALPAPAFSASVTQACDSATILFNNNSAGATSAIWFFGDGDSSSVYSPYHLYSSPGNYSVTLQVVSQGGCSRSKTMLNLIQIEETPSAAFSSTAQSICQNQCVDFSNQSTAGATSWQWIFDGAIASSAVVQNPGSICYPSMGNFDVTLNVSNGTCSNTHTETSFIHVVNCSVKPKGAFIISDTSFCQGTCVSFVDLSTNAVTWKWLFLGAVPATSTQENPTNICYPNSGVYPVTLISGNTAGTDTVFFSSIIQVAGTPIMPAISVSGNILNATPAVGYQWYFNNVALSGANAQQYTALLSGDYSVVISDANGCTSSSYIQHVPLVGIEETDYDLYFYIYPNPVQNEINVMISNNNSSDLTLKLFDELGREVSSNYYPGVSGEETLNLKLYDLAKGIYFLQILAEDKKWVRLVIKN